MNCFNLALIYGPKIPKIENHNIGITKMKLKHIPTMQHILPALA
jgi:hypothetical protein